MPDLRLVSRPLRPGPSKNILDILRFLGWQFLQVWIFYVVAVKQCRFHMDYFQVACITGAWLGFLGAKAPRETRAGSLGTKKQATRARRCAANWSIRDEHACQIHKRACFAGYFQVLTAPMLHMFQVNLYGTVIVESIVSFMVYIRINVTLA